MDFGCKKNRGVYCSRSERYADDKPPYAIKGHRNSATKRPTALSAREYSIRSQQHNFRRKPSKQQRIISHLDSFSINPIDYVGYISMPRLSCQVRLAFCANFELFYSKADKSCGVSLIDMPKGWRDDCNIPQAFRSIWICSASLKLEEQFQKSLEYCASEMLNSKRIPYPRIRVRPSPAQPWPASTGADTGSWWSEPPA